MTKWYNVGNEKMRFVWVLSKWINSGEFVINKILVSSGRKFQFKTKLRCSQRRQKSSDSPRNYSWQASARVNFPAFGSAVHVIKVTRQNESGIKYLVIRHRGGDTYWYQQRLMGKGLIKPVENINFKSIIITDLDIQRNNKFNEDIKDDIWHHT